MKHLFLVQDNKTLNFTQLAARKIHFAHTEYMPLEFFFKLLKDTKLNFQSICDKKYINAYKKVIRQLSSYRPSGGQLYQAGGHLRL
jgi:hypothetical protein